MVDKKSVFIRAMNAGLYTYRNWVIEAFSITKQNQLLTKFYPYQIVRLPDAYYFADPGSANLIINNQDDLIDIINNPQLGQDTLVKITNGDIKKPLYNKDEIITITSKEVPSVTTDTKTLYGNVLFNYMTFIHVFGKRIPFMDGKIKAPAIEEYVLPRLKASPKEGEAIDPNAIYVHEWVMLRDLILELPKYSTLFFQPGNEKTLMVSKDVTTLRDKLVLENKDKLKDPEVIADIAMQCKKADQANVNSDRVNRDFYQKGKSFDVVRTKKFIISTSDTGLSDKQEDIIFIPKSYDEGWDPKNFASLNDIHRAGSFNRGSQTQLGGVSVKELLRASSNIAVTMKNCGTKLGVSTFIPSVDYNKYLGFNVMTETGYEVLTQENINKYFNKTVIRRSTQYCKGKNTDYCEVCAGEKLAKNPTSLSVGISAFGHTMLGIFMAAMHGKALTVSLVDLENVLYV